MSQSNTQIINDNEKTPQQKLNPEIKDTEANNEQLNHQVAELRDLNPELNPQIITLKTLNEQLPHERDDLKGKNEQLNYEIASLIVRNETLDKQIGNLANLAEELNDQIRSLNASNERLKNDNIVLCDQLEQLKIHNESRICKFRNKTMEILEERSCLREQEHSLEKSFQSGTNSKRNADQSGQQIDQASDSNQDISSSLQKLKELIDNDICDIPLIQYLNLIHKIQLNNSIDDLSKEINEDNLFKYMLHLYKNNPNDPHKSMVFSPLRKLSQHQLEELHKLEDFDSTYLSPKLVNEMINMNYKYAQVLDRVSDACHLKENIHEKTESDDVTKEMIKELKCINLESIGPYTFADCRSLEEFILPQTIKIIEEGTFTGCKQLKILEFPQDLGEIRDRVFEGCESIKSVRLSQKFTKLGRAALSGLGKNYYSKPNNLNHRRNKYRI